MNNEKIEEAAKDITVAYLNFRVTNGYPEGDKWGWENYLATNPPALAKLKELYKEQDSIIRVLTQRLQVKTDEAIKQHSELAELRERVKSLPPLMSEAARVLEMYANRIDCTSRLASDLEKAADALQPLPSPPKNDKLS